MRENKLLKFLYLTLIESYLIMQWREVMRDFDSKLTDGKVFNEI